MKVINNNQVVFLLIIALLVTVAGTLINLHKVSDLTIKYSLLTGAATDTETGIATITVQSQTGVTNRVSTITFGSGYVNSSCNNCTMDSINGTDVKTATCCVSFNNVTAGFLIENTGNENVTLNFTCAGSCNASSFVNGSAITPLFQFKLTNVSDGGVNATGDSITDTTGSCDSGGGWNYTDWTDMKGVLNDPFLCGKSTGSTYYMSSNTTSDAVTFNLKVLIPSDSRAGAQQTATLTFTAGSSG